MAFPSRWFSQPCKVSGVLVYRVERATGPIIRSDYEFAKGADGTTLEFRDSQEADEVAARMNLQAAGGEP